MSYTEPYRPPADAPSPGRGAHEIVADGLLNPDLDIDALATAFAETGAIQVHDALRPEVAEILHQCLVNEVPWNLACRDQDGDRRIDADELEAMSADERRRLDQAIVEVAREGFQFRYDTYMMITAYKEKRDPQLVLHRFVEQINRRAWLDAMRAITGIGEIRRSDAQATRYGPGHFLTRHDDAHDGEGRLVAYVMNLSKDWQPDWGGLLQFLDGNDVVETFAPRFNTLSMFRVPRAHCVSCVAPFATGNRIAITGWMSR